MVNRIKENVEKINRREKFFISIIVMLVVVLLVLSWRRKGKGNVKGGKLLLSLE